jgi:tRNA (cytidine/uridine-2'-O-)-methyltransferase
MNVVLINPEIPFNTGNIGRTCVATNSTLHLVGKLGFKINEKEIKRSGLDYWPMLDYRLYPDFETFLKTIGTDANLLFFSTKAKKSFWSAPYSQNGYLVFGNESSGLPKELYSEYADRLYRVPMAQKARSLNLSASAAIVLYEAYRQTSKNPDDVFFSR